MVFGFLRGNPVPGLRKKYDRLREKADKLKDKNKKVELLRLLDQVEPTLIGLEEHDMPRFEFRRRISYVRDTVSQVQDMISEKEDKEQYKEDYSGQ